jgi:hypothetical protein
MLVKPASAGASAGEELSFQVVGVIRTIFGFEKAPSVGDFCHYDILRTFQIRNLGLFLLPSPLGFPLKKITDDICFQSSL